MECDDVAQKTIDENLGRHSGFFSRYTLFRKHDYANPVFVFRFVACFCFLGGAIGGGAFDAG